MSENTDKKSGSGFIARVNLLLTLLLLSGIIYLAYYGFMFRQSTENQFRELNMVSRVMTATGAKNLADLEHKVTTIQNDLSQISNNNVEIYQVSELIGLANQVLLVYGDINGCIRLLNYAKSQLVTSSNPEYDELKIALGHDIEGLNQANIIDRAVLSGEIDGLNDAITKIQLKDNLVVVDKNTSINGSKWQRFLYNIKDTLSGVVAISKTSTNNILLPSSESIAKENIRFDLYSAKVALLGHDQKSWVYNLQNANYYLNTYFKEYAMVDKITVKTTDLLKINVANDDVSIDATIKAVNKLKALHN